MDLFAFVEKAISSGNVCFDAEHDPDFRPTDPGFKLHGCSFACGKEDDIEAVYITDTEVVLSLCRKFFQSDIECVAHNGKYDILCLRAVGLATGEYPRQFRDTMVGANLLWDNLTPRQLGLKPLVRSLFDHEMMEFKESSSYGLDSEEFRNYAKEDASWELRLWHHLRPQLVEARLMALLTKIVCPASLVFSDIEYSGLKWDIEAGARLFYDLRKLRNGLKTEIYKELGNINPDSPRQLEKIFFEDLKISSEGLARTPSGKISVNDRALSVLAKRHPVAYKLSLYRKAQKQINTYVAPLMTRALQDRQSRIRPTFWVVSSTGRTRAEKPNFQNLSRVIEIGGYRGNLRACFVAEEGNSLIIADQSQVELRMIAHISQDRELLNAFRSYKCGKCGVSGQEAKVLLHACPHCGAEENDALLKDESLGCFWHGVDLHSLTAANVAALDGDRMKGKISNFALVYGATGYTMNKHYPEASVAQWDKIREDFLAFYKGVARWHRKCEVDLMSRGVCRDPFLRRRTIPKKDRYSKHGLNQFVNFGPQSGACNLMLITMVKLRDLWVSQGVWLSDVRIVNFVHDEVVVECRSDMVDRFSRDVASTMETAALFSVPLRADIKVSKHCGVK